MTNAAPYIYIYIYIYIYYDRIMHRLCESHLASTTEESPSGKTRSPSAERPVATRTVGSSSTKPPWREREQRQNTARGRERSQTPVERRDRDRPVGVPEPPPPPNRMSRSQWLNQGYQEPPSSSTSYRSYGQYYQQPYYRPRTYNVEYVPGFTGPRNRWIQGYNGDWLDLLPQTPEQSIYFYQPRNQRRRNELDLYGYTFSMGL